MKTFKRGDVVVNDGLYLVYDYYDTHILAHRWFVYDNSYGRMTYSTTQIMTDEYYRQDLYPIHGDVIYNISEVMHD